MLQFPNADVSVLTDSSEIEHVTNATRIDILFGQDGFEFDPAFAKAVIWNRGGKTVRILSKDLLGPTSALKGLH